MLNPCQKPILLFEKHILCWSNYGDLVIDATSGTGTLAVRLHVCKMFQCDFSLLNIFLFVFLYIGSNFLACVRLDMLQHTGHFQGKMFNVRQNTQGGRDAIIFQLKTLLANRERCQSITRLGKQNL